MNRRPAFFVVALAVVFALAMVASPFASSAPDGLERVATDQGFVEAAGDHQLADSPVAGYGIEGVDNEKVGTGLAGLIGVAVTFGIGVIVFSTLKVRRRIMTDTADTA